MLVIKAGIPKMLVRIENWEDPDQWVCTVCQYLLSKQLVLNLKTFIVLLLSTIFSTMISAMNT